ncbi:MAG: NusG domain II-containing protein [Lachnospiraceae bacterium]|nr:NusG domain II-containing protein [Lachnospiraceae bacterium]
MMQKNGASCPKESEPDAPGSGPFFGRRGQSEDPGHSFLSGHRGDLILAAVIILAAGIWQLFMMFSDKGSSAALYAVIYVDGKEYSSLPLSEDRQIRVEGFSGMSCLVNITSGKADVTEADCPDRLCVRQKSIGSEGETIVCLPARIVVEVRGEAGEEDEYDAFSM